MKSEEVKKFLGTSPRIFGVREWDFSLPFRKHSRPSAPQQARLAALLVFVTRLQKRHTVSFLRRLPTPSYGGRGEKSRPRNRQKKKPPQRVVFSFVG